MNQSTNIDGTIDAYEVPMLLKTVASSSVINDTKAVEPLNGMKSTHYCSPRQEG